MSILILCSPIVNPVTYLYFIQKINFALIKFKIYYPKLSV